MAKTIDDEISELQMQINALEEKIKQKKLEKYRKTLAKRTPEEKAASAAKAKATRAANKERADAADKKWAEYNAERKNRETEGKLPLEVNGYWGKPDSRFYDHKYNDPFGGGPVYKLKDKWKDKVFSKEMIKKILNKSNPY